MELRSGHRLSGVGCPEPDGTYSRITADFGWRSRILGDFLRKWWQVVGPNPHWEVAGTPSGLSRPLSANLPTLITRQGPARLRSQLARDLPLRGNEVQVQKRDDQVRRLSRQPEELPGLQV